MMATTTSSSIRVKPERRRIMRELPKKMMEGRRIFSPRPTAFIVRVRPTLRGREAGADSHVSCARRSQTAKLHVMKCETAGRVEDRYGMRDRMPAGFYDRCPIRCQYFWEDHETRTSQVFGR